MSDARCVVLLRGVNVGASNRIAMPQLRSLLEDLGGTEVQTYLQSGNAVLGWSSSAASLQAAVEQALRERLSLEVPVLVRTGTELETVVRGCPFDAAAMDPKLLHAVFLDAPPPKLPDLTPDRVVAGDRVLYVAYAVDAHSSTAARLFSSKRFPVVASARNWRTVLALRDLARA